MVKFLFINISFLGSFFFLSAQEKYINLEIEPKTVEVGNPVTIVIKTNIDGEVDLKLPDAFITSGARKSGMQTSVKIVNGKKETVRYNFQSFTGYFEKEGVYSFDCAQVLSENKKYKSKKCEVTVVKPQNMISDDPKKLLDKPIFGLIEQSEKEIYEGESLVVEGKVYSQVEVLQIEDYTPFELEGSSDNQSLFKSGQISTEYENINNKQFQTFKIGKTLIFPEKVGEYKIKPFQTVVLYNDRYKIFPSRKRVVSNEAKVIIKPLPPNVPDDFIDAVGQFSVSASINNLMVSQGDVVELRVKIKGIGNLHNIKKPPVNLPEYFTLYGDPEEIDSINFTIEGAEGSKTFIYFIQANRPGNIKLDPIKISYFNPITEKYETSVYQLKTLHIKPNAGTLDVTTPDTGKESVAAAIEMRPYLTENTKKENGAFFTSEKNGALVLFSPLMLGALFGFAVRFKNQNIEKNKPYNQYIRYKKDTVNKLKALSKEDNRQKIILSSARILIDFLAFHFKVNPGEITRSYIKSKTEDEINSEIQNEIIEILDEADSIKFGKSCSEKLQDSLLEKTKTIIHTFEK